MKISILRWGGVCFQNWKQKITPFIGIGTSEDPIILTYSTHALMANL